MNDVLVILNWFDFEQRILLCIMFIIKSLLHAKIQDGCHESSKYAINLRSLMVRYMNYVLFILNWFDFEQIILFCIMFIIKCLLHAKIKDGCHESSKYAIDLRSLMVYDRNDVLFILNWLNFELISNEKEIIKSWW